MRSAVTSPLLVSAAYVAAVSAAAGLGSGGLRVTLTALAIALGLVIGVLADLVLEARSRGLAPGSAKRAHGAMLLHTVLLVASLHTLLVAWGIARMPSLHAERLWAKGGFARTLHVIVADVLGPWGVIAVGVLLLVVYVRPRRIVVLARRAVSWSRSRAKRLAGPTVSALVLTGPSDVAVPGASPSATAASTASAAPAGRKMNVLVLAVDGLRDDRVDPRVAPSLTALAGSGTRFERAYVSAPAARPSWRTLLTGRYAHHRRGDDVEALPARFAHAGYATAVVGDHGSDFYEDVTLGFERLEIPEAGARAEDHRRVLEGQPALLPILHSTMGRRIVPAMRGLARAADPRLLAGEALERLSALSRLSPTKRAPFYLHVAFGALRAPYTAPAPYTERGRSYRGRFRYDAPILRSDEVRPDGADVEEIRALYDRAVSAVDDALGRVLHGLDELGIADDTIVVVVAAHGESLFERGRGRGNGTHLFGDETTHVPLVIRDPRVAPKVGGRRERHVVRDVDLAPTLYELAGVAEPAGLDGRSFASSLSGADVDERIAFAEADPTWEAPPRGLAGELRLPIAPGDDDAARVARHRMARDARYKLLYVPTREAPRYLLFDTQLDPLETEDVASVRPEVVTRLKSELWRWMLADPSMEQQSGWLVPRGGREP